MTLRGDTTSLGESTAGGVGESTSMKMMGCARRWQQEQHDRNTSKPQNCISTSRPMFAHFATGSFSAPTKTLFNMWNKLLLLLSLLYFLASTPTSTYAVTSTYPASFSAPVANATSVDLMARLEPSYIPGQPGREKDLYYSMRNVAPPNCQVRFQMKLYKVSNVMTENAQIDISAWLRMWWSDPRLAWNPADYGGTNYMNVPATELPRDYGLIWTPEVELQNNLESIGESFPANKGAVIQPSGETFWSRSGNLRALCTFEGIELFPFDKPKCHLIFSAWSMDAAQMDLVFHEDGALDWDQTDDRTKMAYQGYQDLSIESVTFRRVVVEYTAAGTVQQFPELHYSLTLKRASQFYLLRYVMPQFFFAFAVFLVFLFEPDFNRLNICILFLLVLMSFDQITSNFVPKSEAPILISYLTMYTVMVTIFAFAESAVVQWLWTRDSFEGFMSLEALVNLLRAPIDETRDFFAGRRQPTSYNELRNHVHIQQNLDVLPEQLIEKRASAIASYAAAMREIDPEMADRIVEQKIEALAEQEVKNAQEAEAEKAAAAGKTLLTKEGDVAKASAPPPAPANPNMSLEAMKANLFDSLKNPPPAGGNKETTTIEMNTADSTAVPVDTEAVAGVEGAAGGAENTTAGIVDPAGLILTQEGSHNTQQQAVTPSTTSAAASISAGGKRLGMSMGGDNDNDIGGSPGALRKSKLVVAQEGSHQTGCNLTDEDEEAASSYLETEPLPALYEGEHAMKTATSHSGTSGGAGGSNLAMLQATVSKVQAENRNQALSARLKRTLTMGGGSNTGENNLATPDLVSGNLRQDEDIGQYYRRCARYRPLFDELDHDLTASLGKFEVGIFAHVVEAHFPLWTSEQVLEHFYPKRKAAGLTNVVAHTGTMTKHINPLSGPRRDLSISFHSFCVFCDRKLGMRNLSGDSVHGYVMDMVPQIQKELQFTHKTLRNVAKRIDNFCLVVTPILYAVRVYQLFEEFFDLYGEKNSGVEMLNSR